MIVKFNSEINKQYIGKVLSVCRLYDTTLERFIKWYRIKPLAHHGTWTVNENDIIKVYR